MVVRDIDVLQDLFKATTGSTVCISVPTVDEDAWRTLEPGTAHPLQRLRAVRALVDAGIDAGVLMAPLVPGFSTSPGEDRSHHQGHRRSRRALRRRQPAVPRRRHARSLHALPVARVSGAGRSLRPAVRVEVPAEGLRGAGQKTVGLLKAKYGLAARETAPSEPQPSGYASTGRSRESIDASTSEPDQQASALRSRRTGSTTNLVRSRRSTRKRSAVAQIWLSGIFTRSSMTRFRKPRAVGHAVALAHEHVDRLGSDLERLAASRRGRDDAIELNAAQSARLRRA